MKALLLASAALLIGLPAQSETVYLVTKSKIDYGGGGAGVSLHSIPMSSIDQCEEQGAILVTSKSFDLLYADQDAFVCITGK